MMIVMCVMALITHAIGVNTVLGAFVAGVLIGESPILSRHIDDQLRGFITAFMMPVFFGLSGLSADLTVLKSPALFELTIVIVAIASIGKFLGAFSGGMISGLSARESIALGCGLNARGSTEVIVATIGLTMGILTQNLYTMIVTMAVITTTMMPPMLRWALRRIPLGQEEKERLEREEADAKGFVTKFERLLLMADDSANGKFASRIAGFIAGQRGIPITVMPVESLKTTALTRDDKAELKEVVTEGAKEGHRARKKAEEKEDAPARVEVTARPKETPRDAVAKEAGKGYDMLFVGVTKMRAGAALAPAIDEAVLQFDGSVALSISDEKAEIGPTLNVLVPVNGTETARRGAEIAFALAPPGSRLTVLYVAERQQERKATPQSRRRRHRSERALTDDMQQLAKRYGHQAIEFSVHTNVLPHEAILEEAQTRKNNLIVIGTSRRVGNKLALGETAATILAQWKGQSVFVVS
jgi:nucleotide-binding universal stress UspA family protein